MCVCVYDTVNVTCVCGLCVSLCICMSVCLSMFEGAGVDGKGGVKALGFRGIEARERRKRACVCRRARRARAPLWQRNGSASAA